MTNLVVLMVFTFAVVAAHAQIPERWSQHKVTIKVNVPIGKFWPIFRGLALEEVGSKGKYKRLPKIVSTTPVSGDFTKAGHSRTVNFDNGKSVLETIVKNEAPYSFVYELTEIEIALKSIAHKARGWFQFTPNTDGSTQIEWTYGFYQKNVFAKWVIKAYIRGTHRHWMSDSIAEIKRLSEEIYANK